MVEQNLAFALRVADHVYLMSKGRIVHEARPVSFATTRRSRPGGSGTESILDNIDLE
jgi:ABC-type branched-subunit amino acid transport system ATPase component